MQDRLDNLYDKVAEFEEAMKDIDAKIGASYGKEITGKKLYEFLLDLDILYDIMTDMEKKEFMNTFIEKIELKNETVNNGTGQVSRIEHIDDVDITSAETKATYDKIKRVQLWKH